MILKNNLNSAKSSIQNSGVAAELYLGWIHELTQTRHLMKSETAIEVISKQLANLDNVIQKGEINWEFNKSSGMLKGKKRYKIVNLLLQVT